MQTESKIKKDYTKYKGYDKFMEKNSQLIANK